MWFISLSHFGYETILFGLDNCWIRGWISDKWTRLFLLQNIRDVLGPTYQSTPPPYLGAAILIFAAKFHWSITYPFNGCDDMQSVQQLIQWISALHRPFQAIKGRCYTRGSDYTWRVHRKWVIWNRSSEVFIDNVSESVWTQILFLYT